MEPAAAVVNRNVNSPVTVHYDSLVTVNGDVNDTNHFIAQVAKIAEKSANKAVNGLVDKMYDGLVYGR